MSSLLFLDNNTAGQRRELDEAKASTSPAGLICYWAAKLESNSFTAVKIQDYTESLTSWQYCRISSFLPKQLLVPEVSGSHFPVWMFTCIFSFPQNMAIWGSATANPVPALAARACEDKPKENTLIALSDQQLKEPETLWHLLRQFLLDPEYQWSLANYFLTTFLEMVSPSQVFTSKAFVCPNPVFYNWNNNLPKPRVIPPKRLHAHGLKQMSQKLTK